MRTVRTLIAASGSAAIALTWLASCSVLTTVDDLTGGPELVDPVDDAGDSAAQSEGSTPDDSAASDAPGEGATTLDAAPNDATTLDSSKPDTSVPDTGVPDTSAPDTSAPDTSVLTWCAKETAAHLLCDDFDDPNRNPGWTVTEASNGTQTVDSQSSSSAPASLFVTTTTLATTNSIAQIARRRSLATLPNEVSFTYALKLEKIDLQAGMVIGTIEAPVPNSQSPYSAELVIESSGKPTLEEAVPSNFGPSTYTSFPISSALPTGQWHQVKVSVAFGAPHVVTISFDGAVVLTHTAGYQGSFNGSPKVSIGGVYMHGPSAPWNIRFDNVTVDVK